MAGRPKKSSKIGKLLPDIWTDLCENFIDTIPEHQAQSLEALCSAVESARDYYEESYRIVNPLLPSLSLKEFGRRLFQHWPPLQPYVLQVDEIFAHWAAFKLAVPIYGAVLLNSALSLCVLVVGRSSHNRFGFPQGCIHQGETPIDCAIREVFEQTGYDCSSQINERDFIEAVHCKRTVKLFIVLGVPDATVFDCSSRKDLACISWQSVDDLPISKEGNGAYFNVIPFVQKLRFWVVSHLASTNALSVPDNWAVASKVKGQATVMAPPKEEANADAIPNTAFDFRDLFSNLHLEQAKQATAEASADSAFDSFNSLLAADDGFSYFSA